MFGNPEGVEYISHPFGIPFRSLTVSVIINPSDLKKR